MHGHRLRLMECRGSAPALNSAARRPPTSRGELAHLSRSVASCVAQNALMKWSVSRSVRPGHGDLDILITA
eukprot:4451231-Prymnesium_polylepis.1